MVENLLSLAIWTPIVAGLLVIATGGDKNANTARLLALAGAALGFLVTLPLYTQFDTLHGGMQFEEKFAWIASLNINYHLGVDGIVKLRGWRVI